MSKTYKKRFNDKDDHKIKKKKISMNLENEDKNWRKKSLSKSFFYEEEEEDEN